MSVVFGTALAAFALYSAAREYDLLWVVIAAGGAIEVGIAGVQLVRRRVSRERIPSGQR
jgi:hypothetical protein